MNKKEKYMKGKLLLFFTVVVVIGSLLFAITVRAEDMGDVHIHVAEFTGYYPANNSMEGGFKAITGEWLDPSAYTVAAPHCIPIGSKITIGGTGGWRDGVTYTVNDRGGAIYVDNDGVYHIDILMASREQANNFGRKRGYIIVEDAKK